MLPKFYSSSRSRGGYLDVLVSKLMLSWDFFHLCLPWCYGGLSCAARAPGETSLYVDIAGGVASLARVLGAFVGAELCQFDAWKRGQPGSVGAAISGHFS